MAAFRSLAAWKTYAGTVYGRLGRMHPGIWNTQRSYVSSSSTNSLTTHLRARLQVVGPITVAEYMREALINPQFGYYMQGDVFGKQGDFITSPEISQVFGELLGIWMVSEISQTAKDGPPIHLMELGPGRGTLMADILRMIEKFSAHLGDRCDNIQISMVEASDALSQIQMESLKCVEKVERSSDSSDSDGSSFRKAKSSLLASQPTVSWFSRLSDVPRVGSPLIVGHEFLDALPAHQMTFTEEGWREKLVDLNDKEDSTQPFRLVLAPSETAATKLVKQVLPDMKPRIGQELEISFDALTTLVDVGKFIAEHKGTALFVDYGEDGGISDTIRAFRNHKQVHLFDKPGHSDITVDVNFQHAKQVLAKRLQDQVKYYGPIPQRQFLFAMGLPDRVKGLSLSNPEQAKAIKHNAFLLIDSKGMGERFKFFCISNKDRHQPPITF